MRLKHDRFILNSVSEHYCLTGKNIKVTFVAGIKMRLVGVVTQQSQIIHDIFASLKKSKA